MFLVLIGTLALPTGSISAHTMRASAQKNRLLPVLSNNGPSTSLCRQLKTPPRRKASRGF
jgi:hypothetical protein